MSDFLEQVVAERRAYVREAKSLRALSLTPSRAPQGPDRFTSALVGHARRSMSVIAEVKRISPALGQLAPGTFDVVAQARRYVDAGATAISVLTEPKHWGGSLDDLAGIRSALRDVPLLCKDVVVDEYQLVEAQRAGADAVLLIAEALDDDELGRLIARARTLGVGVLLEAHEPDAFVRAVRLGHLVGVNARDLRHPTDIDPQRIDELAPLVRREQVLVAESGIGSAEDVRRLPSRVDAVLVGTALMRATDPGALIREIASIERVTA